ncbi:T9SS type A sorting domain-containing protein [Taibaiella lutea]|uniref:T9SS type A sorting domain-containing protein n=1 Tax=Taibaiella lutea TaxID=2608001 RepID=A0A5M6CPW2_9BACT|nr:T9SS type A sorting domain-containing protein [Taibaiella lutea]KAA5536430.1 T9SS type A sorting domain-containing protein [Taibaiella lutea]
MKRLSLTASLFISASLSFAQISSGGFPLSIKEKLNPVQAAIHSYEVPDWQKAIRENKLKADKGLVTPYVIGLFTNTDIGFPESGSFTYLPDGKKIWKADINIDGAPGIGLYYDRFHLPEGVKYYISNESGKQVLGAYTKANNQDGAFANEAIQGHIAHLELDIDADVAMDDINLHIEKALVYYASIDYLSRYENTAAKPTDGDPDPYNLEGHSSTCEINATCPQGANYAIQRKATVQLIIPLDSSGQAGVCSGALINNTGNTPASCTPYILTATHCDLANNSNVDAIPFRYMLIRFNFEKESCNSTVPATVSTLNGVNLVARANYVNGAEPHINGDFMLLKPKAAIPDSWDAYLNGWNRSATMPAHLNPPQKYIGFHHAAADIKKLYTDQDIDPDGEAGGSDGPGTHWAITSIDTGGIEQGSSGSSLFDKDGYTIGIASVAGDPDNNCAINSKGGQAFYMKYAAFSKISYDWDYSIDGDSAYRKLKPWLDPVNTGAITLNPVKANCNVPATGVTQAKGKDLNGSINIYPNPNTTGIVNIAFNFAEQRNIQLEIYSITGTLLKKIQLSHVAKDNYFIDLSAFSNGMYLLKFSDGNTSDTQKIMLNR